MTANAEGWRVWIARLCGPAFLITGLAAWSVLAAIDSAAYRYPDHATGPYTVALEIKGVVRFVTEADAFRHHLAVWVFNADIAAFFVVAFVLEWSRRRHRPA